MRLSRLGLESFDGAFSFHKPSEFCEAKFGMCLKYMSTQGCEGTFRPVGQAVKTSPFHGGNGSSILPRVTNPSIRNFYAAEIGCTTIGWVQKYVMVQLGPVVQLVSTSACHAEGHGFEPRPGR